MHTKLIKNKNNPAIVELILDIKDQRVNILKTEVLFELENHIAIVRKDKKTKVLLIKSAKKDNFIAGADINEIKDIKTQKEALKKVKMGQDILNKLANLHCITVCYINGSCMGGGTELALACDFRVAGQNEKTLIGLPEVNLGIFPGFGGTQRLPRLIGLMNSLPIILSGKPVNSKKAYKIGLVDHFFPHLYEKTHLPIFLNSLLNEKFRKKLIKKRKKRSFVDKFLKGVVFSQAKKNILKVTKGHYPAPLKALEVIKKTHNLSNLQKGLDIELQEFAKLVIGEISKNLISLYFINEDLKKEYQNSDFVEIKSTAILGAGVMGGGIAWLFSKLKLPVRMKDLSYNAIALGYQQITKNYQQLLKIRKITKNEIKNYLALVSSTIDYSGLKNVDLISEAIIEDIKIKKNSFQELEKHISKNTIIASNSSALSINEMAKSLKNNERFLGMHFFNPVNRMPLVEIIPHKNTSEKTISSVVHLIKKAKKTPIVVGDCAGFLVNRILLTFMNESFLLLDEIGDVKKIDKIAQDFGMPMGCFILADTVGLDVGYKVAKTLEESYGTRMKVAPLIDKIYNEKKLLGKKAKKGVYEYKGKMTVNKEVEDICKKNNTDQTEQDILDRLILIMVNEAARCLEEKIVKNYQYLDMAMIMGTGFPAFRGGLIRYAKNLGMDEVIKRLKKLEKKFGSRFKSSPYLKNC